MKHQLGSHTHAGTLRKEIIITKKEEEDDEDEKTTMFHITKINKTHSQQGEQVRRALSKEIHFSRCIQIDFNGI